MLQLRWNLETVDVEIRSGVWMNLKRAWIAGLVVRDENDNLILKSQLTIAK